MKVVSIMGKAGSGKTTTSRLISEILGYAHISTGELARTHISGAWQEMGMTAPEDKMRHLVSEMVDKCRDEGYEGIVIDGMPRKPDQVRFMKDLFKQDSLAWVNLSITDTDSVKRLLARRRGDDTDEAIESRITIYNINQDSIEKQIKRYGYDIIHVDATQDINKVISHIIEEVQQ